MTGYIDSIETMGLVDGPGIRLVVFMSGCKLRCSYCHNPETWNMDNGTLYNSDDIVNKVSKNMSYYKKGGITFSGGEPLLQADFLIDCLKKCHEAGIHTALDTAGVGNGKYEEILAYTDLVILDIKAIGPDTYKELTGNSIDEFNKFMKAINDSNKPVWIRQVVVPGINDNMEYMNKLKLYLKQFNNIEKVELLPYHLYGIDKYKKLGIPYKLDGVKAMTDEDLAEYKKLFVGDL
jgi:pyruvate formate lyase activating enzyme